MITIKVNDQALELPDDFSLTWNGKSPVFNDIGSFSFPFKLPYSARNAAILNFKNRVSNAVNFFEVFPGEVFYNGIPFFSGTVKIRIANAGNFEATFYVNEGDFYYKLKNKTLQDVDFGELTFYDEQQRLVYINACKDKIYPERVVAFPEVYNPTYFEETPTDTPLLYFNYYTGGLVINNLTTLSNRTVIVPMLYVRYVLTKVFEYLGYTLIDIFFNNAVFNSLVLFNSVDCNSGPSGYFPDYDLSKLLFNYHVPRMSLGDFIKGIETFFNIRFFVNNTNRSVTIKSLDNVVKNPDPVPFPNKVVSLSIEPEDEITGYHLKMSMETDDEFWASMKTNQDLNLEQLKDSVDTVSDLPAWPASDVSDWRWVKSPGQYFFLYDKDNWVAVPDFLNYLNFFSEAVYRNGQVILESKFSTLMHQYPGNINCVVGVPQSEWKSVLPKVFFAFYENDMYGNKKVGRNTSPEFDNMLFFYTSYGLFQKYFKAFLDFRMSTKLVKVVIYCDFIELRDLDFSCKYMISGTHYLIKDFQLTIKKNGLSNTTFTMYPV